MGSNRQDVLSMIVGTERLAANALPRALSAHLSQRILTGAY